MFRIVRFQSPHTMTYNNIGASDAVKWVKEIREKNILYSLFNENQISVFSELTSKEQIECNSSLWLRNKTEKLHD